MNLTELTVIANDYTDENFSETITLQFANEAIAKINIELKSKLPYFNGTEDYLALDEAWLRTVVVPYIAYSIKMNDGSLNEAMIYEGRWKEGLFTLRKNKRDAILEEFQTDSFANAFKITQYGRWKR